jgi:NADH-quinone oxidoreductase subunit L
VGGFMGLPDGLGFTHAFKNYLNPVIATGTAILAQGEHHLSHATEILLMALAMSLAIAAILYASKKYVNEKQMPHTEGENLSASQKLIYNKFFLDEVFEKFIVKPITMLSDIFLVLIDKLVIDLAVNATALIAQVSGKTLRLLQSGNTGFYLFLMVSGAILLFIIRLFVK